jgi:hypothetical protein
MQPAGLEHSSAKWIRFAVKKCGTAKKRADSMTMDTAIVMPTPRQCPRVGPTKPSQDTCGGVWKLDQSTKLGSVAD